LKLNINFPLKIHVHTMLQRFIFLGEVDIMYFQVIRNHLELGDYCLTSVNNFSAISWWEHVTHRCISCIGHLILIHSQPVFALTP